MDSSFFSKVLNFCSLLTVSLFVLHAGAAEVYKWTDENGNIHYSDKKPNYTESTNIQIKHSRIQQQTRAQHPEKHINNNEPPKTKSKESLAQDEARKKEIKEKCVRIRENLKIIAETSRIRVVEDGTPRYLSPEEITTKKMRHEEQIQEFCQ